MVPTYDNVDPAALSPEDLAIITGNGTEQTAHDPIGAWTYTARHHAQPILDYLYLGPSTVMRNRQWLQDEGFTMILGARDKRQASLNMMSFDKLAEELGIEARCIDVEGVHELTSLFPVAIRTINNHMLRIHREQMAKISDMNITGQGMANPQANYRRGKVLVFCETGNDRSASFVCAYIMAIFGKTFTQAYDFMCSNRLCAGMDDNVRHFLTAYEDILRAQRTVHQFESESRPSASLGQKGQKRVAGEVEEGRDGRKGNQRRKA
ncbi:hypothetical protein ONZ43_g3474 [Nemania bipapillata]|uniref:Uncharacterized protein n=1 Tax=Nemania bipapillata TaxID=110536 RepID=A0ACC2IWM9_9PEZI|nr:hypothetical protein ONZ43_g3474 [Nemania bipapillata]